MRFDFDANQLDLDPFAIQRGIAAQQLRNGVDAIHRDVHGAIVVVIAKSAAARRSIFHNARAALFGHLFKAAVLQIAVEIFVLGVFQISFRFVDLGINVAVRHQNVEPAIIVHIEKADAPTQQPRVDADAARVGAIFKCSVAQIRVERIGIAGEIGFYYVQIAVAIVIANGNAHAGLRLAFRRQSARRIRWRCP